ncbi:MAG: hypothetical protein MUP71_10905, partial [Candidatus Aminicenantes bacterium]|nr:hypothetical protein [Candidatus Aminicenantes bacterium]
MDKKSKCRPGNSKNRRNDFAHREILRETEWDCQITEAFREGAEKPFKSLFLKAMNLSNYLICL